MSSTPLNDPEWDQFDRALLASAELDKPESGALARAMRALGPATLGSALLVSTSASLGASIGAKGATVMGVSWAALTKALLVGAVVGVGFVGVVNGGYSPPVSTPAVARPTQSPAPLRAAPQKAVSLPGNALSALPSTSLAAEPGGEAPSRQNAPENKAAARERGLPGGKLASAPPVVTTLAVEVALLDRARAALARKDPTAALSELNRYAALSFGRSLEREANLLRIEALRDLGRAAGAADLAKQLVDEDPQGLTGQRARELMR